MDTLLILPPRSARKPRRPRATPPSDVVELPRRDRRPEQPPPPVLDALAMDEEYLALCDEHRDDAREHQDANPDAELADLPEWMHTARGLDGERLEHGYGEIIGTRVDGAPMWRPWPRGEA